MFGSLTLLTACGAILDLPDNPTIDNDAGSGDGGTNTDGPVILVDGAFPDGFVPPTDGGGPRDGSIISPDGGPHTPCGPGGTVDCLGGACVDNICQAYSVSPLAGIDPTAIDSDGTNVFFVSQKAGIDRYNAATGTVDVLVSAEDGIQNLSVFGSSFYFTRTAAGAGGLWGCPTNGIANACGLGTGRMNYITGSSNKFSGVVADATTISFTYDQASAPMGVYHCGMTAPCTAVPLASTSEAHQIRERASTLFWNDDTINQAGVYEYNLVSGTPSHGSDGTNILDFAVDGTSVYYTTATTVTSRPLSAAGTKTIISARTSVAAVGVDDTYVYWLDSMSPPGTHGVLQRCAIADDCTMNSMLIQTLATDLDDARDMVVTADSVYISTLGNIYRVIK